MLRYLAYRLPAIEFLLDWREFRRHPQLCLSYGGTMPDGRARVCDKPRFHGDSHTYEFGVVRS